MSREDFIAVAARLFSVYLLFLVIRMVPNAVQSARMFDMDVGFLGAFVVVGVVGLVIAGLLWLFPLTVARKLLPVMKEPRSDTAISGTLALSLGLTLMGVWFLAGALVDAVYWLVLMLRNGQLAEYSPPMSPDDIASIVATIAEFLVAFVLLFGNAGIRRLILRYRYGKDLPAD